MQHRHTRRTTWAAALVALTMVAGTTFASSGAVAKSSRKPTIVFVGDSITQRYKNKVGDRQQGWWSILSHELEMRAVRFGERGSGYTHRGKKADGSKGCQGTTFASRLLRKDVRSAVRSARVVVLEGGVNDFKRCRWSPDGKHYELVLTTPAYLRTQVRLTMRRLAALRSDRSSVYVTAPYGPRRGLAPAKEWILDVISSEARRAGFTYVDTAHGPLEGSSTVDGVHPNRVGNKRLADQILATSDVERWIPDSSYSGMSTDPSSSAPPRLPADFVTP